MKYINFHRENNNFDDILNDPNIKKYIDEKIQWKYHLILGLVEDDKVFSYITLKYGDSIRTSLVNDFKPIPNIDYVPVRR